MTRKVSIADYHAATSRLATFAARHGFDVADVPHRNFVVARLADAIRMHGAEAIDDSTTANIALEAIEHWHRRVLAECKH